MSPPRTRTTKRIPPHTVSTSRQCKRGPPPEVRLLQFMDPPEHRQMRSVLNKLFTPRAIQLRRSMITTVIDKYLGAIESDESMAYYAAVVQQRRAQPGEGDLFSLLMAAEIEREDSSVSGLT